MIPAPTNCWLHLGLQECQCLGCSSVLFSWLRDDMALKTEKELTQSVAIGVLLLHPWVLASQLGCQTRSRATLFLLSAVEQGVIGGRSSCVLGELNTFCSDQEMLWGTSLTCTSGLSLWRRVERERAGGNSPRWSDCLLWSAAGADASLTLLSWEGDWRWIQWQEMNEEGW